MQTHWLYRPENIRKLWRWGSAVLALTVLGQIIWHVHGHFGFDGWFAFFAIYGYATCVAMIVLANWLGRFVKRGDTYYER